MSATRSRWWSRRARQPRRTPPTWCEVEYEELPAVIDLRRRDESRRHATLCRSARQSLRRLAGPGARARQNEREVAEIIGKAPHVARVTRHQPAHGGRLDGDARRHRRLRQGQRQLHAATPARRARTRCAAKARAIMGVPNEKLRVITDDVGGAFGMKTPVYPEYPALLVAARKLGRPVHWQSTRSEAFVTDTQARDTVTEAELAIDEKGKFLALRVRHLMQPGRLCEHRRRRHQHQQFRALPARHVPNSEGRRFSRLLLHQHHPDRPLSRCRATGSKLRA